MTPPFLPFVRARLRARARVRAYVVAPWRRVAPQEPWPKATLAKASPVASHGLAPCQHRRSTAS